MITKRIVTIIVAAALASATLGTASVAMAADQLRTRDRLKDGSCQVAADQLRARDGSCGGTCVPIGGGTGGGARLRDGSCVS